MQPSDDTLQLPLPDLSVLRILIVDDDELLRQRLAALLQQAGFDVLSASSLEQARGVIEKEPLQIAIIDRDLNGDDGTVLCQELRGRISEGYVYVFLLTMRDSGADILSRLEAGADEYLSKKISDAELVARLRSATRIVRLERSLRIALEDRTRAAETDALTHVFNRRYFERQIVREWRRALRFGQRLSLLMLDIDHFKQVNDTFGHGTGDEVLQGFARRIKKALPRAIDWAARMGGEEFVVVLPETDLAGARTVAERLRREIEAQAISTSSGPISITVSIGVGSMGHLPADQGAEPATLLDQADLHLYRSKLAGRNRVTAPNENAPVPDGPAPNGPAANEPTSTI
jgi:diguanylate cyclase (GGDEF)-like protein